MSTEMMELNQATANVNRFLAQYLESQVSLWDSYVDPREAYLDGNGEIWDPIGGVGGINPADDPPFRTCQELFAIQSVGRFLWKSNEYAINGHKNRINYIIGTCHNYTVVGKTRDVPEETIQRVQDVLDEILKVNRWSNRQKEIKLRDDRDGETFVRKFRTDDGIMRFRFIEPRSVQPPNTAQPHQSFGVETEPDDHETVIAYHVNDQPVDASDVQHRKFNVDSSMKRGFALFFPVRKNLSRAAKLLRNMSLATEIQTAIALIRKHNQATKQAVRSFLTANSNQQLQGKNGKTENVFAYGPGSIIDVPIGQEYDVPKQLDPSKTISALQAELRAIASRLVMPEFMLTADASNANFSSTMVAEGPAVKNFESEQETQKEYDLELLNEAMEFAADSGLISKADWDACEINAEAPSCNVRDKHQEAQVRKINMELGILSHQTASADAQLDYEQEQTNIELHDERNGMPLTDDRPEF